MTKGKNSDSFEKALTELCKILDVKVDRLNFDYENELVTIVYSYGGKIVNVFADSDTAVVIDVMRGLQ